MTQQTFAQFIQMSPASLSSVFNGRTKPTLNIVEAIKQKIPAISTDWLMFGRGQMYTDGVSVEENASTADFSKLEAEPQLDFDDSPAAPSAQMLFETEHQSRQFGSPKAEKEILKNLDKKPRQITEIRIFFDDQTWESFVPKK